MVAPRFNLCARIAFDIGVLPRSARRPEDLLAKAFDPFSEGVAVEAAAVVQNEAGRILERKGFGQLLIGPGRGWMRGDAAVQHAAAVVGQSQKHVAARGRPKAADCIGASVVSGASAGWPPAAAAVRESQRRRQPECGSTRAETC
jgi:hypothetical protein